MGAVSKRNLLAASIALLLVAMPVWAAEINYKWTTPDGEIRYEKTPPDDPDQPYEKLYDGIVVEIFDGSERHSPQEPAMADGEMSDEERQRRSDQLLRLQFKSLAEIDSFMGLELGNLQYDYDLLNNSHESQLRALFQQIKIAADRQRAQLPIEDHEIAQIEGIKAKIVVNRSELAALKVREISIKEKFRQKRQRYQELIEESRS